MGLRISSISRLCPGGKRLLIYWVAETGRSIISKLPAWVSYSVASRVGDVVYYCWPRGRRNMVKSVANILNTDIDNPEVRQIARRCMRNFCKYIADMLRYHRADEKFFDTHFQLSGRDNLDGALKEGKGVILVSFHMGNLDLGIRLLSSQGYPVNAIVDKLEWSKQLNIFLQKPRAHNGAKLINSKEISTHILELLRKNEIIALMIDCPNCLHGVKVKLGQKWVLLPTGAATLAMRTGARLIPCGLVRTSNNTFRGIIGRPIEYHQSGKMVEDVKNLTQNTVLALEEMTRQFLDQWYIFHPLFKDELQDS
jgi:lauroyl/myristoyl acyltransferase